MRTASTKRNLRKAAWGPGSDHDSDDSEGTAGSDETEKSESSLESLVEEEVITLLSPADYGAEVAYSHLEIPTMLSNLVEDVERCWWDEDEGVLPDPQITPLQRLRNSHPYGEACRDASISGGASRKVGEGRGSDSDTDTPCSFYRSSFTFSQAAKDIFYFAGTG